jgi:adenosylmethionine-8-amino-7-oxononanoate aminotransferase
VRGARRLGTIAALEIGAAASGYLSSLAPELYAFFGARDVLLRPLGSTLYVMPPYCIGDDDLDAVYAAIGEAVDRYGRA